jgi:hypothetical protein
MEHKIAAYRYYINRMNKLPLNGKKRTIDWQTILRIAHNNFPARKITTLRKQVEHNNTATKQQRNAEKKKNKWTTFTYYSPKDRKITNLFKHTGINIAFKSSNSIQRITNMGTTNRMQEYKCSGIYALTCKHKYIGQTSRELNGDTKITTDISEITTHNQPSHYTFWTTNMNTAQ